MSDTFRGRNARPMFELNRPAPMDHFGSRFAGGHYEQQQRAMLAMQCGPGKQPMHDRNPYGNGLLPLSDMYAQNHAGRSGAAPPRQQEERAPMGQENLHPTNRMEGFKGHSVPPGHFPPHLQQLPCAPPQGISFPLQGMDMRGDWRVVPEDAPPSCFNSTPSKSPPGGFRNSSRWHPYTRSPPRSPPSSKLEGLILCSEAGKGEWMSLTGFTEKILATYINYTEGGEGCKRQERGEKGGML
eukprot:747116-Hanusia_phi.AAC.2